MPTEPGVAAHAKKRKSESQNISSPLLKKSKKPTACRTCHARKVKCSGEQPCANCAKTASTIACVYPERDANITVKQSYIAALLAENEQLRATNSNHSTSKQVSENAETLADDDITQKNPLLGDGSWFVSLNTNRLPIHIHEAADTAFATRFRQALSGAQDTTHIPRTNYVTDGKLASLTQVICHLPSEARARLLIRVSMSNIRRRFDFVDEKAVMTSLKQQYRDRSASSLLMESRLLILLALGEAYSSRSQMQSEDDFPGLSYFTQANRSLLSINERPQIELAEILLLLALYALFLNRRHNAYFYATGAVNLCLIMGLHSNIPQSQLSDTRTRLNLKKLWWSAYTIERMIASLLGHPVSIQDQDIEAELLPAINDSLAATDDVDIASFNANVALARLSRDIIATVYSRRVMRDTFSQRVQRALKNLRGWVEQLPKHLQIDVAGSDRPAAKHVRSLHTTFNQCVILATRPILLHLFRTNRDIWAAPSINIKEDISETAIALAEACIRCARHSIRLFTESWIDSSLTLSDHFDTHYLFSATVVLAISSISIGRDDGIDSEMFETGREFLHQLKQNGNFAASECCVQLEKVEIYMAAFRTSTNMHASRGLAGRSETQFISMPDAPSLPSNIIPPMTAEMALAEPSMQDFLSQAELDLGFLDAQIQSDQFQGLYWPELSN